MSPCIDILISIENRLATIEGIGRELQNDHRILKNALHTRWVDMTNPYDFDRDSRFLFLKSPQWDGLKTAVLRRANLICERCKAIGRPLQIHHLTYDRFGGKELLTDLLAVCEECHRAITEKPNRDAS